jgi:hypothetical protein
MDEKRLRLDSFGQEERSELQILLIDRCRWLVAG